jgi:hypothetical protein
LPIVRGKKNGRGVNRCDNKAFSPGRRIPATHRFGKKTAVIADKKGFIGNIAVIDASNGARRFVIYIVILRYYLLTGTS